MGVEELILSATAVDSSWYRVADLRPTLSPHSRVYRHVYRGQVCYLLYDRASGRSHIFPKTTKFIISLMDGNRSLAEISTIAIRRLGESAPTQSELISLLHRLHSADLLRSNMSADTAELFARFLRHEKSKRLRAFANPMAIQVRLWDPDVFLERIAPLLQGIWSRWGGLLWLVTVLPAIALIPPHWAELSDNISDRLLSIGNLVVLYFTFPVLKAWHELGHASAIKARGGEVHDIGVILLGFLPVPYVDASAASVLRSKYDRALVGVAGVASELIIAALAYYLWLLVEPGLFRAVLFNIMTTAGVSTLIFNGNPLLRYDAYYVLSDLAEIPNLASRATSCWRYLWYRFGAGVEAPHLPVGKWPEMPWLLAYGIASSAYRALITVVIALFIAGKFFFVGVLIAAWATAAMLLFPIFRSFRHIFFDTGLQTKRARAFGVALGLAGTLACFLFFFSVPYTTTTEGIVWLPEEALVRAGTDGIIKRFLVSPGGSVGTNTPLLEAENNRLQADIRIVEANIAALRAVYRRQYASHSDDLVLTREKLNFATSQYATLKQLATELVVHAHTDGRFIVPEASDLAGRFMHKGELIGYVIGKAPPIVRVVVTQAEIDQISIQTDEIKVRLADRPDVTLAGRIVRSVPNGDSFLPSRALSADGGGSIATDPRVTNGSKALERIFQFDVRLAAPESFSYFGQHVYVQFQHKPQPLMLRWYRFFRLLFLSHLTV